MSELYKELIHYIEQDIYPMHMPGHKRNENLLFMEPPIAYDITEIEGFDDLQQPKGILQYIENRMKRLYGSDASFIMVNGSSGSLMTAMKMCSRHGDSILMARNCHKSAYHGCIVHGLNPVYLYPEWREKEGISGGIQPEQVEENLKKRPDISFVLITSPTYDGVVSDIPKIANICHIHGIPLIVDEAHGPHFAFHEIFPETAIHQGADLVIHSLHKTLPAMTQTSALHLCEGVAERFDITPIRMKECINLLQTTSPSYVLMASVAECFRLLDTKGSALYDAFAERLRQFYNKTTDLKNIHVLPAGKERDPGKILISLRGTNITGAESTKFFREKHMLETEMHSSDFVMALTSVADTDEGFRRLLHGVYCLDQSVEKEEKGNISIHLPKAEPVYSPEEAWNQQGSRRWLPKNELLGKVSLEYVYLYPPGIPLLAPGERITEDVLAMIDIAESEQLQIKGREREDGLFVFK